MDAGTTRTLGRYRLTSRLGAGGMGEVYRAVDESLGRSVAIKLLPGRFEADGGRRLRLLREAQAAGALHHPGIVTLFDVGFEDGQPFLVMELVEGEPFSAIARRGTEWRDALALCAQAARALRVAHARGILHRDIKSDNLMRGRDGQVKVLDFGLAKLQEELAQGLPALEPLPDRLEPRASLEPPVDATRTVTVDPMGQTLGAWASPPHLTRTGKLVGTPAYMAPEQATGGVVDVRSEVFSLGIVLYQLLSGSRPFDGATVAETIARVTEGRYDPPSQRAPERGIPAAVDRVVARALAREPAERFADMEDFAAALEAAGAPGERPWLARRGWRLVAGALAMGATALLVSVGNAPGPGASPERRIAPAPRHLVPQVDDTILNAPAISRDGSSLAFRRGRAIVVRNLATSATREFPMDQGEVVDYLDWFPDGERLLICDERVGGGGGLSILSLQSGQRRALLNGAYGGRVSPDGRSVAFVVDDSLQVVDVSVPEHPRRLLDRVSLAARPAWSPDGRFLAAAIDDGDKGTLEIVGLDGRPGASVGAPGLAGGSGGGLVWLRDRGLVYSHHKDRNSAEILLRRLDAQGRLLGDTVSVATIAASIGDFSLTSDGHQLVLLGFTTQPDLDIAEVSADGTTLEPRPISTESGIQATLLGWAGDGHHLVVVDTNPRGARLVGVDGEPGGLLGPIGLAPAIDAAGASILDAAMLADGSMRWQEVPVSGGAARPLATTKAFKELGQSLRHTRCRREFRCVVMDMDQGHVSFTRFDPAAGTEKRLASVPLEEGELIWDWSLSRDGSAIVMAMATGELLVTSTVDGTSRRLPKLPYVLQFVDWAADGKSIFVTGLSRVEPDTYVILSIDMNGEAKVLTRRLHMWFSRPRLSPDGRRLAFNTWNFHGEILSVDGL